MEVLKMAKENGVAKMLTNGDPTGVSVIMEGEEFFLVDNGVKSGPLKTSPYQHRFHIHLIPNTSNRKLLDRDTTRTMIEKDGKRDLTYKATVVIGSVGSKTPNEKLTSYLSEEDQAIYNAIIARAREAYEAAKAKPMTEAEKLEAKIKAMMAKLEKLEAAAKAEATTEGE